MNQDKIAALKAAAGKELAWMTNGHTREEAFKRLDERGNYILQSHPSTILALLAERDALIARAEAAERDAELLGFIEANPEYYLRQSKRHWWFSKGQYPTEGYKTMREAISAAMENEKC